MTSVLVLIVNYNTAEAVGALISSLGQATCRSRVVVSVIDNSQSTEEWARLREVAIGFEGSSAEVILHQSELNLGYGVGNNYAASVVNDASGFDVCLVVNPDVTVVGGSLDDFVELVATGNDYTFWTAETDGVSGLRRLSRWSSRSSAVTAEGGSALGLHYPGGHFLAMKFATWRELGGFSSDYFLYSEEIDLVLRAAVIDAGTLCRSTGTVSITHVGGLSTKGKAEGKSTLTRFHSARSKMLLYRNHRLLRPALMWVAGTRIGVGLLQLPIAPRGGWSSITGIIAGLCARRSVFEGGPSPKWLKPD